MERPRLTKGLIQVYTGNAKGKTTAAMGLAFRALGHGFRVAMVQFMKGSSYYGEIFTAARLYPSFPIYQFGRECTHSHLIRQGLSECFGCGDCFVKKGEAKPQDVKEAHLALDKARELMLSGEVDILILDEINNALYFELLTVDEVVQFLKEKPSQVELVLTGRNAPKEILEMASLVTEMVEVKHPFAEGVPARRGIEY